MAWGERYKFRFVFVHGETIPMQPVDNVLIATGDCFRSLPVCDTGALDTPVVHIHLQALVSPRPVNELKKWGGVKCGEDGGEGGPLRCAMIQLKRVGSEIVERKGNPAV